MRGDGKLIALPSALRTNLDPFGEYDDAKLWDALRRSYLTDQDKTLPTERGNRFHLDMTIDDEGLNLSVGERSLVSLARALVKDSRVVILDEAVRDKIHSTSSDCFQLKVLLSSDCFCGCFYRFPHPTDDSGGVYRQDSADYRTQTTHYYVSHLGQLP